MQVGRDLNPPGMTITGHRLERVSGSDVPHMMDPEFSALCIVTRIHRVIHGPDNASTMPVDLVIPFPALCYNPAPLIPHQRLKITPRAPPAVPLIPRSR